MASVAALVGVELLLGLPAVAHAETVAPLGESNYAVQPVCRAVEPRHAGCLALALQPRTAAARAHRHPIGITRRQALRAASAAEGSYGLRPEDLQNAYFHGLSPQAPVSEPQTIALVDAYNDYEAEADLTKYDQEFGLGELARCGAGQTSDCFEQVNQQGESGNPPFPRSESELIDTEDACLSSKTERKARERDCEQAQEADGWAVEISTDIEVARGICQNCRIVLVEADSSSYADLEKAENAAVGLGATEVSNSWGGGEPQSDSPAFDHPKVVITASAGDDGYLNWTEAAEAEAAKESYYSGANYPASSPHVVAVGGTKLTLTGGARASETAWNEDPDPAGGDEGATGGGCSSSFSAPIWQSSVPDWSQVGCGSKRAVSDVAADADPYTGVAVYDTMPYLRAEVNAKGEEQVLRTPLKWVPIGGTSVASPIIASIFALAGGAHGVEYPAQTLYSHRGQSSLYDVTSGGNGKCDGLYASCSGSLSSSLDCGEAFLICKATTGYDGPTGVGAPNGIVAFEPTTSEGGGEPSKEEKAKEPPQEERPLEEKTKEVPKEESPRKEEPVHKEQPQEEPKLREPPTGAPILGSSSPSGAVHDAQAQILALALTKDATNKLHGHDALADEVIFRFKLSLSASVRISLAHLFRSNARETWRELSKDTLAFKAAAGTSREHLDTHNTLAAGTYRLTLSIHGGGSRSIVFTVG
ncbi:MAG TPA: S8 family serine peptidase [Solirubrobacteraceae bacterium]|jgi:hypothetical protein|nr:S8 family serine peptidase [Solirubrobacteraceae bacterium]